MSAWLSLGLSAAALLAPIILVVVASKVGLKGLIPRDAPSLGGKVTYDTYVAPVVELVTGFGFFGGVGATVLAIAELRRARKGPEPRQTGVPVIALLLGLAALPTAAVVLVVVSFLEGPWAFG